MLEKGKPSFAWCMFSIVISMVAMGCGGQTVEPLDPRDVSLPIETRRWIAANEDGVIVARARLDAERVKLRKEEQRQEHFEDELSWGTGADVLSGATLALAQARVRLAELRVAHAEAELQLAEAKYRLATAERAISHDLARYDLAPLRAELASVRAPVRQSSAAVADQRRQLEKATSAFWKAYAAHVAAGGDSRAFWIGTTSQLQLESKTGGDAN